MKKTACHKCLGNGNFLLSHSPCHEHTAQSDKPQSDAAPLPPRRFIEKACAYNDHPNAYLGSLAGHGHNCFEYISKLEVERLQAERDAKRMKELENVGFYLAKAMYAGEDGEGCKSENVKKAYEIIFGIIGG